MRCGHPATPCQVQATAEATAGAGGYSRYAETSGARPGRDRIARLERDGHESSIGPLRTGVDGRFVQDDRGCPGTCCYSWQRTGSWLPAVTQPEDRRAPPPACDAPMAAELDSVRMFLLRCGANGRQHPGGTLYQHVSRVADLLADWGASDELQAAGLCHACCGTDGYAPALLSVAERPALANLIGTRSESLVYLYASCDRAVVYPALIQDGPVPFRNRFTGATRTPPERDIRAFLDLTAANALDVIRHSPELAAEHGPACYGWSPQPASGCRPPPGWPGATNQGAGASASPAAGCGRSAERCHPEQARCRPWPASPRRPRSRLALPAATDTAGPGCRRAAWSAARPGHR